MRHATRDTRRGRLLLRGGLVAAFVAVGLHGGWLLLHPGSHAVVILVDNIAQGLIPLIFLFWGLLIGVRASERQAAHSTVRLPTSQRWAPRFLLLAVLAEAVGQALWTYYENVVHQPPFPSWADAGYLAVYPFLLGGIFLLLTGARSGAARLRLALDGLVFVTGIATVSWYFVLGPTVLQGGESLFAKIISAASPLCDLALLCCLLLLTAWGRTPVDRATVALLACAFILIVAADSAYTYQQLHGAYMTGELLDVLWPFAYALIALAAGSVRVGSEEALRRAPGNRAEGGAPATAVPHLRRALAHYAVLPVVAVLTASVWGRNDAPQVDDGVFLGAAILVVLVVLRQIVAMRETITYTERLHALSTNNAALATANAQLEILATTDVLTGLANRSVLRDRLDEAVRGRAPAALLLLDLDRFKEINDTLGHQVGDLLLQTVAARLRATLSPTDTVARLGGDEFAVLLPDAAKTRGVEVAKDLLSVLEKPVIIEGQTLAVEGSIGLTLTVSGDADASTLLRQADVAMYAAKRARSGYALYNVDDDEHDPERLSLMGELRQALDEDALALYYQPQAALAGGRTCAVEALLRWRHPTRGFIPPDVFIPLAEQTGLIAPLTRWVLETALRQAQTWRKDAASVGLSVNLSARTVHDPTLPALIADLLDRYAVPPDALTLEITESTLMIDPVYAHDTLSRLKALGVRLSIDDFGTGYSSLGYLKQLSVDEVKIDKSFVRSLGTTRDVKDAAIVQAVIAMAGALGLLVVAEGVETEAAWERLRKMGCTLAQGYYLARPLPAPEAMTWLHHSTDGLNAASQLAPPSVRTQSQGMSSHAFRGTELSTVFAAMACGVVRDASGIVVDANAEAERILGCSLDDMRGRPLVSSLGAATRLDGSPLPAEERPAAVAYRTGQPQCNRIMSITRPDGCRRWVRMDVVPTHDDEGRQYFIISFLDVTALKEAEDAVSAADARSQALEKLTEDAVIGADADGRITAWTTGSARLFGYTAAEAVGMPITSVLDERIHAALQPDGSGSDLSAHERSIDLAGHHKSGQALSIEVSSRIWADQSSGLSGRLIHVRAVDRPYASDVVAPSSLAAQPVGARSS